MQSKKITLLLVILAGALTGSAQITSEQLIADSSFGWMKIYHYKGVKTSRTLNDKVFSPAQLSLCDSFSNWIQASYIPKGCIGDVRRMIGPGENIYNPTIKYQPQIYGTTSYTWSLSMENGKPKPIQETEIPWGITANEMPGNTITCLNSSGDNYFFMEEQSPFAIETPRSVIEQFNIKTLPQFKNFHTLHSTSSRYDRNAAIVEAVILCKDNKLPFIQVSIGELLNKCEKMIQQFHEDALKSISEKNNGNQKSIDYFNGYENEKYKKALAALAQHKEKYKNSLNEPAMIARTFDYTDFSNGQDIFTRVYLNEKDQSATPARFPVYKLPAGIKEQSRQDKPLWIRITWNWMLSDERTKHMHESIINNFNFDYLYNFIFAPEKVKGVPYKPLHNPAAVTAVVVTEKSGNAKKAANDPAVFYFEDFSSGAAGQTPANWYSPINDMGSKAKVVTVNGLDGKWLEIKGQSGITPNNLSKPLPADFDISFDIAVPKDIAWGSKAFEFYIGTAAKKEANGTGLGLRFRAGFGGRDGELQLNPNFGNGYFTENKTAFDLPGFSNDKPINKIAVRLKKTGQAFEIIVNGNSIAKYVKAFPDKTLFRWLQISQANSDAENQKYYFSNFKILQ